MEKNPEEEASLGMEGGLKGTSEEPGRTRQGAREEPWQKPGKQEQFEWNSVKPEVQVPQPQTKVGSISPFTGNVSPRTSTSQVPRQDRSPDGEVKQTGHCQKVTGEGNIVVPPPKYKATRKFVQLCRYFWRRKAGTENTWIFGVLRNPSNIISDMFAA